MLLNTKRAELLQRIAALQHQQMASVDRATFLGWGEEDVKSERERAERLKSLINELRRTGWPSLRT